MTTSEPTELELQQRFSRCVAKLLILAAGLGFELTFADAYRDPAYHPLARLRSGALSCHAHRLAVDLNLFVGGEWKKSACDEWTRLGRYWEALDPLCRWGGNWDRDQVPYETGEYDVNHFSITFRGVS